MPRPASRLPLRHAVALGVLHGPAELLPISSSAHTELVPWLLRWPYADLDPELRKAFEVALHAGTAAALVRRPRADPAFLAVSLVPPVVAGFLLERPIERRLGRPVPMAVGLLVGAAALAWADAVAPRNRHREQAGLADALALGVAQACALVPGVSRNGATLTAARLRGFDRRDAGELSWDVALPVIVGATALKGARLARSGLPARAAGAFAAGAAAAFASTLAAARLVRATDRSLAPFAAYRAGLATVVLAKAATRRDP